MKYILFSAFPLLCSCAISYKDAQGSTHRIGFFAETISIKGEILNKSDKAVGLRIDGTNNGLGLSVGYREKGETFLIDSREPICLIKRKQYFEKTICDYKPKISNEQ